MGKCFQASVHGGLKQIEADRERRRRKRKKRKKSRKSDNDFIDDEEASEPVIEVRQRAVSS